MTTEESNKKEDKTKSEGTGPVGSGMLDVMGKCCPGEEVFANCSTMMKGMIKKMGSQSCCAPSRKEYRI